MFFDTTQTKISDVSVCLNQSDIVVKSIQQLKVTSNASKVECDIHKTSLHSYTFVHNIII